MWLRCSKEGITIFRQAEVQHDEVEPLKTQARFRGHQRRCHDEVYLNTRAGSLVRSDGQHVAHRRVIFNPENFHKIYPDAFPVWLVLNLPLMCVHFATRSLRLSKANLSEVLKTQ